jgi:nicotinate phosphoribosyltransferase
MDFKARCVREKIVQNLADVDFYKLTMLQFIWNFYRETVVTFRFKNRTSVKLPDYIDLDELRARFARVTKMRFPKWCLVDLKKNYGHLFKREFLDWLGTLKLDMPRVGVTPDGNLLVEITGPWAQVMLWETITMCVVNRLYFLAKLRELNLNERDVLAEGRARAVTKFDFLAPHQGLTFVDFGTRRRWSYAHHQDVLREAIRRNPRQIVGTSNVLLGLKIGLPLVGTMAHELTMGLQGVYWLQDEGSPRLVSQRMLWRKWASFYNGELTIVLPDTYGNDFGLEDFKEFAAQWVGVRHDSGDPFEFGEKVINFYAALGINPKDKAIVFSDGLTAEVMIGLWTRFNDRIRVSFGWGTHLTNDMGFDVWVDGNRGLKPLPIVVKLEEVLLGDTMISTVKVPDNPSKATGSPDSVSRVISKTGQNMSAHKAVVCEV